ncbi:MAG: hypothetical protein AAF740_14045, partial [Bacteroidota bacterium]
MITEKENIADTFYAFHDGDLIFEREEGSNQVWKIECEYLAEMINPEFKLFWIKIYDCKFLQFEPWMNPIELPKEIWTGIKDIFKTELEILSAKEEESMVEISCNQHSSEFNFCGGQLLLDCEGIEVYDEEWDKIELERLGE